MQLDADDLLARIRKDYPSIYKICELSLLVEQQAAEIDRLNGLLQPGYDPSSPRPFLEDGGRHV